MGLVFLGGFLLLPQVTSQYITAVFFTLFVYIGYAVAFNIFSGLTGYIVFGNAFFIGVGGYTSVLLVIDLGIWWPIAWLLAGVSTAVLALIVGIFMLRLKGSYFAIGTLALLLAGKLVMSSKYLTPVTRGGYGFAFIEPLNVITMYYALFVIALLTILISYKVITSNFGSKLIAIREDEDGACSIGINATANKIEGFVLSAFLTGVVASGHVAFQNYIDPEAAFNFQYNITPILMALLGGLGTFLGPIIGAIILTFVQEFFWSTFTEAYLMIYGLVMVFLVLLMPGGIIEWLKKRGAVPKTRAI
jgi:branched-chain amino acid transport system permease protein